jgi:hypothetical protein
MKGGSRMKAYVPVFIALLFGIVFPNTTRTQDFGKKLDAIYRDESHCLVGPEIRNEKHKLLSCYCRDALMDARYVYLTYLLSQKDRNLNGTYLTLESNATQICGKGYDVHRAVHDTDWRWDGPAVTRKYPPDGEIAKLKPDDRGWRTVEYKVELVYRDPQGRPLAEVESFTAVDMLPPKGDK